MRALDKQEGGDHYKKFPIQPVEFCHKNKLGFIEGSIVKYVCRWRDKGKLEDLKKVKHYTELLIELEGLNEQERDKSISDPRSHGLSTGSNNL